LAEHRVLLTHDRAPATQRINRNIPQNLGLCWQNLGLFSQNLGLFSHTIGLFWQNIGLVFHITRHTQLEHAARLQKHPAEYRIILAESRALWAESRALLAEHSTPLPHYQAHTTIRRSTSTEISRRTYGSFGRILCSFYTSPGSPQQADATRPQTYLG